MANIRRNLDKITKIRYRQFQDFLADNPLPIQHADKSVRVPVHQYFFKMRNLSYNLLKKLLAIPRISRFAEP